MTDFIQIQWTCGSIEEARKVSRFLVQERIVACANIVPWSESVYMWNNELETEQETKVFLKTRREHFDRIKEIITKNTKYEVPEILFFRIEGGSQAYLDWLGESSPEQVLV